MKLPRRVSSAALRETMAKPALDRRDGEGMMKTMRRQLPFWAGLGERTWPAAVLLACTGANPAPATTAWSGAAETSKLTADTHHNDCERDLHEYVTPTAWSHLEPALTRDAAGRFLVTDGDQVFAIDHGSVTVALRASEALGVPATDVQLTELHVGANGKLYVWDARQERLLVSAMRGDLSQLLQLRGRYFRGFQALADGRLALVDFPGLYIWGPAGLAKMLDLRRNFCGGYVPTAVSDGALYVAPGCYQPGIWRSVLGSGELRLFVDRYYLPGLHPMITALASDQHGGLAAQVGEDLLRVDREGHVLVIKQNAGLAARSAMLADERGDIYLTTERTVLVARCRGAGTATQAPGVSVSE